MHRGARHVLLSLGAIVVTSVVVVLGAIVFAHKRADAIKSKYSHLVGSPSVALTREFRAPDRVERLAPITYVTDSGEITARHQPYVVFHYDLLPGAVLPLEMRVLIDDMTDTIIRFRGPFD